jgi:hypothetical protein
MSDPQTLSYESPQTTLSGVGLGTIALQIVGVYCIVLALPIFSVLATFLGASGFTNAGRPGWQILFSFIMPGLYCVIGVLLIRYAARLSVWLFGGTAGGVMVGPVTALAGRNLQAIAFSVVGVMTMIDAAPRLVSFLWFGLMDMGSALRGDGFGQMIEPIAKFLFGLALFLQAKGLSLLWHKIRAGGVMQPSDTTEPSP